MIYSGERGLEWSLKKLSIPQAAKGSQRRGTTRGSMSMAGAQCGRTALGKGWQFLKIQTRMCSVPGNHPPHTPPRAVTAHTLPENSAQNFTAALLVG